MRLMDSQIYNVDETGVFFRCLPDRTYISAFEKSFPEYKIQIIANSDGSHKLVGNKKRPEIIVI